MEWGTVSEGPEVPSMGGALFLGLRAVLPLPVLVSLLKPSLTCWVVFFFFLICPSEDCF